MENGVHTRENFSIKLGTSNSTVCANCRMFLPRPVLRLFLILFNLVYFGLNLSKGAVTLSVLILIGL